MTQINFARRILESTAGSIFEIMGTDARGRQAYYFVKVPRGKSGLFQLALNGGSVELTHYGIVIASGFGTQIPESVRTHVMNGTLYESV